MNGGNVSSDLMNIVYRERSYWKWMDGWVGCTNCNESKWLKWKKWVRSCFLHFKDLGWDGDPAILLAVITGVEEAMKGNVWNYGRTERDTVFVLHGEFLSMCAWWGLSVKAFCIQRLLPLVEDSGKLGSQSVETPLIEKVSKTDIYLLQMQRNRARSLNHI